MFVYFVAHFSPPCSLSLAPAVEYLFRMRSHCSHGVCITGIGQYPGEKEITFPPFTCLESNGDPRVERTQGGEIVVFPLQVRGVRYE